MPPSENQLEDLWSVPLKSLCCLVVSPLAMTLWYVRIFPSFSLLLWPQAFLNGVFSLYLQRLDGFLAVLNVSGGSFSPPSRKLPFSVTSVDGDCSLLYYASIDLAGNLPSSKVRGGSRGKKSSGSEGSRSSGSRFRIPVKGCVQLVGALWITWNCSHSLSRIVVWCNFGPLSGPRQSRGDPTPHIVLQLWSQRHARGNQGNRNLRSEGS